MAIVLIIIVGVIILLQIFLSKKQNKWVGIILPCGSFAFSMLFLLNMEGKANLAQTIISIISTTIISNIPTIILLIIYFACRENVKRKSQLEKMNIQDL